MLRIEKKNVGWKVITDNDTYYVGQYSSNGMSEGVIYKDDFAFETGEGVCYINEYGFDNSEQNSEELFDFSSKLFVASGIVYNPYVASFGYTRKDFENLCEQYGFDKDRAAELYVGCFWQNPETYIQEWDDEE